MGRIFILKEIDEKRIPQVESFDRFGRFVRSELSDLAGIGLSTMFFGSYAIQGHNRRSDIDCLIVHPSDKTRLILKKVGDLQKRTSELYVSFSPVMVAEELAIKGIHSISGLLKEHLVAVASEGAIVGGDPTRFIAIDQSVRTTKQEALDHMIWKLHKLQVDVALFPYMDPGQQAKALQKSIEATRRTVWKVVQVHKASREKLRMSTDGYRTCGVSDAMVSTFRDLVKIDEDYSDVLDDYISRSTSHRAYLGVIEDIRRNMPTVVQFIADNIRFLADFHGP